LKGNQNKKTDTYGKGKRILSFGLQKLKNIMGEETERGHGRELLHTRCNPTNLSQLSLNN